MLVGSRIWPGVESVLEQDLELQWIRVPLDVQCSGMRSLQWFPYLHSELSTSSQVDLLRLVGEIAEMQRHGRSAMPVLVNVDIHYRFMKMKYGL